MPADNDGQIPMFGGEDLVRMLVRTAELQRETASIQQQLVQQELALLRSGKLAPKPRLPRVAHESRPYRPANVEHRTWRGFVLSMQKLERLARAEQQRPTKQAVCGLGPESVKTVTRTMRHYGLHPEQWPPSTWDPEHLPSSGQI